MAEDVRPGAALRTLKITHVLDNAENRHIDLLEHRQPAARIDQRKILRRRNDHCALQRYILRQRQLRIAGAGRHIDDENIERSPRDIAQHLGDGGHHHRTAPYHRGILLDQKSD